MLLRSPGWLPATWWQIDLHLTISITEGATFCSYCYRYSGYGFIFPTHNVSAKMTITDLQNALSTITAFHTMLLQIKDLTSQKKWSNGPLLMEFTGISMFSINSWAAGWLDSRVEWLFENSVTVPTRWQQLTGLRQGSPEGIRCSRQCLLYGAVSLIARIHYFRNQGVEKDGTTLTNISSDHPWNFCPFLATLHSAA